ncbi:LysR family transcriptional regulator [Burkholderia ubonensis]|uniref:LysR family transcriptional regulator n=1 Tax=Burkholderia ubonensis TaxID=101571 RepID=UPI000755645B|nr:LysR family transcriptional regulator [Burkholderia ubonensis]KWK68747.1 transcriptional regulator [Burkholderia ubonensis]
MELNKSRQVQCFETIMIERSLRKAAERLDISASEVSRQLRKLEAEMKIQLFSREPSGLVPTREAELFLEYHRSCESQFEVFKGQVDALHSLKTGVVSISVSESMMVPFMTEVMWEFRRDYPGVRLLLNQRATREIVEDVLTDAAHIGLAYNALPTDGISVYRSVRDGLIAAVHPDHPLAKHGGPVPFARAVAYPFATMPSLYGIGGLMESVAHTEAVKFKPVVVANTLDVLRRFALQNLGVAFVSTFTIKKEVEAGTLVAVPIDHPALGKQSTSIIVKASRRLSAAAEELLKRIESDMSAFSQ